MPKDDRTRSPIAAVFFDAGGTLIHADPPPGDVYAAVGADFGSRIDTATARSRFAAAFRRRNRTGSAADLLTSEAVEDAFWRAVVAEVLDDLTDFEGCYRTLFAHFARPGSWTLDPEAGPALAALAARGLRLGLCSNFDARLHGIVAGMPALRPVEAVVVSSEVGWRKPAPEFFAAVARRAGPPPQQVLVVGDDPVNDYEGARAAGLAAVLLDPQGRSDLSGRIARLADLPAWLERSGR
jgi:putative hydrolase of the HAD superfamily